MCPISSDSLDCYQSRLLLQVMRFKRCRRDLFDAALLQLSLTVQGPEQQAAGQKQRLLLPRRSGQLGWMSMNSFPGARTGAPDCGNYGDCCVSAAGTGAGARAGRAGVWLCLGEGQG